MFSSLTYISICSNVTWYFSIKLITFLNKTYLKYCEDQNFYFSKIVCLKFPKFSTSSKAMYLRNILKIIICVNIFKLYNVNNFLKNFHGHCISIKNYEVLFFEKSNNFHLLVHFIFLVCVGEVLAQADI